MDQKVLLAINYLLSSPQKRMRKHKMEYEQNEEYKTKGIYSYRPTEFHLLVLEIVFTSKFH